MTQKYGYVRNPLTVIAIFAAIAEISGTTVLPFISEGNQATYVWFLMFFPALLVCVFFVTLNFNHKVLYAPSDYKDEANFLKLFGRATPEEREEKFKEEVEDASEVPPNQEQAPLQVDNGGEGPQFSSGSRPRIDAVGGSLIAKITLAEKLAISDLSKRLGVSLQTDVRFMINANRHYLFDGMAVDGNAIHVLEVKLIRYMTSLLGKFDKTLLEAEQITYRLPKEKKLIVHLYAVIDDEKLGESGRLTVESVTREMERVTAKYAVEAAVSVLTLRELEERFTQAA